MNVVAIIQARMSSERLPRKVMADLVGRPVIVRLIDRLKLASTIDSIVLATPDLPIDKELGTVADEMGVLAYAGHPTDLLARYVGAAKLCKADVVVRITADCPFTDPGLVDQVVTALLDRQSTHDYATNGQVRTYPRGLDVEALFADVLYRIDRMATTPLEREHVTVVARGSHPELFRRFDLVDDVDNSDLRLTVDTPEDMQVALSVASHFKDRLAAVTYAEIVRFLRSRPDIIALNSECVTWTPLPGNPAGEYRL